jgi:hypothetical protein
MECAVWAMWVLFDFQVAPEADSRLVHWLRREPRGSRLYHTPEGAVLSFSMKSIEYSSGSCSQLRHIVHDLRVYETAEIDDPQFSLTLLASNLPPYLMTSMLLAHDQIQNDGLQ